MGEFDELYEKARIFNELFSSLNFVIETKDYYNYPDKIYESYIVNVKSNVDIKHVKLKMVITSVTGEIHEKIERFFKSSIPPQLVDNKCKIYLEPIDAYKLLFLDNWNRVYLDILIGDIEKTITSIEVEDAYGKIIDYYFNVRDIYFLE